MSRRLRREFQGLESLIEPGAQERNFRALIDKVLYDIGSGPTPIVEQLRLRERLRTLHARRDRYNHKRYTKRLAALLPLIDQRHVIGAMAIRLGLAEATGGPSPRDLLLGLLAGDRRLSRKFLDELAMIGRFFEVPSKPWEMDQQRIDWEAGARPLARVERGWFAQTLLTNDAIVFPPAAIPFGFEVPLPENNTNATSKTKRFAS
ncbi:MAG: hypothetical protein ACSHX9_00340 [Luteolibacter sp.]